MSHFQFSVFRGEITPSKLIELKTELNRVIDKNEDFMRETLFSFYETYSRLKINELLIPLLKLYSDIILASYINFEEKGHYF